MPDEAQIPPDRHARILDAAERCFARMGFHRSTMQDVAAECGMSPGNLYRYFPSKEAMVIGLAERDRAEIGADFQGLRAALDPLQGLAAVARKHLIEMPRERAALVLEIWAEATRNPAIGESCRRMEREIGGLLTGFLSAGIPGGRDGAVMTALLMAIGDGIIRRRATDPCFDPTPVFDHMMAMVAEAMGAAAAMPPAAPAARADLAETLA
jgi:AcrR family transcriptional regulator